MVGATHCKWEELPGAQSPVVLGPRWEERSRAWQSGCLTGVQRGSPQGGELCGDHGGVFSLHDRSEPQLPSEGRLLSCCSSPNLAYSPLLPTGWAGASLFTRPLS